jgi:hypothetical protein
MSNINSTCPHRSRLMQFPAVFEGKQGKCPSCKAEGEVTPDNPVTSIVPPEFSGTPLDNVVYRLFDGKEDELESILFGLLA